MSKDPSEPHFRDVLLFYFILMPGVGFFFMLGGGGEPLAFILTCMVALFSFPLASLAYRLWGRRMRRRWLATLLSALAGILSMPLIYIIFYSCRMLVGKEPEFSFLLTLIEGTLFGLVLSALIHVITAGLYLVVRAVVHRFSRSADTQAFLRRAENGLRTLPFSPYNRGMSKDPSAPHFRDVLLFYFILMPVVWSFFEGEPFAFHGACWCALFSFPSAALVYGLWGRRMRRRWLATLVSALAGVLGISLLGIIYYVTAWSDDPELSGALCTLIISTIFHIIPACFYISILAVVHGFSRLTNTKQPAMSDSLIIDKMKQEGLSQAAISAFLHGVEELRSHAKMQVPEADIRPAEGLPVWDELVSATEPAGPELLAQTVLIKLNGGLGTSMGLQQAKSLLEIKPGLTFLDLIVRQVQTLREQSGSPVQLLLMNSFSTSADTMQHLARYAEGGFANPAEVEMLQNKVPKLAQDTLEPISWPARPELEWCPPGHGDIYAALAGSGWLEKLLARGIKYAFISNSDNLGAQLDTRFLRWFAESGAPFVMEVTPRTEADKKGGHLAIRQADGQPILREVAQCPAEDVPAFQDISRHRYFNTNNLWIRLDVLSDFMAAHGGIVPLPVICNAKHVDPRDASTPPIYQLETAMGAALQCFPGARAVCVPRTRFFPVKTCADLLLLRSDAVVITPEGEMQLAPECGGVAPVISLDGAHYKLVDSLESLGVPSLKHVRRLTVHGQWSFAPGEPLSGEIEVGD